MRPRISVRGCVSLRWKEGRSLTRNFLTAISKVFSSFVFISLHFSSCLFESLQFSPCLFMYLFKCFFKCHFMSHFKCLFMFLFKCLFMCLFMRIFMFPHVSLCRFMSPCLFMSLFIGWGLGQGWVWAGRKGVYLYILISSYLSIFVSYHLTSKEDASIGHLLASFKRKIYNLNLTHCHNIRDYISFSMRMSLLRIAIGIISLFVLLSRCLSLA